MTGIFNWFTTFSYYICVNYISNFNYVHDYTGNMTQDFSKMF